MSFNVQIEKSLLNLATSRVQGALSERSQGHLLMKAQDNRLHVSAADQTIAVFNDLATNVLGEGVAVVPSKLFSDVCRELPEGPVNLKIEQSFLKVQAGPQLEFTMRIPLIENGQWRDPPPVQYENSAILPVTKLAYMIDQIDSCVSVESPRNYGTVALLHRPSGDKDHLRLVGTDSFRLSLCDVRVDMPDQFLRESICLTKRALNELARISSEGFDTVKISVSDDKTTLVAEVMNYTIFIRLSSVKYPNYASVIPDLRQPGVLVNRTHVQSVARRVLLASDKTRVLQLSFSDSSLTLSSKNTSNSEGREKIHLEGFHGARCDIVINGKYLTDIVGVSASEKMIVQYRDSVEPMVLTPYGEPSDCKTKHVLVPYVAGAATEHHA